MDSRDREEIVAQSDGSVDVVLNLDMNELLKVCERVGWRQISSVEMEVGLEGGRGIQSEGVFASE